MESTSTTYDTFPGPPTTIDEERTTVAAVFADRQRAHDAAHQLHEEGFRDTWIGIARTQDAAAGYGDARSDVTTASSETAVADPSATQTRIESDNWFMRFFGEGDESLSDALVRHGVRAADAEAAGPLAENSAILTVDGRNQPELAAQIVTQSGGRVITRGFGATGYGTPGAYGVRTELSAAPTPRTTSLYDDAAPLDATDIRERAAARSGADIGLDPGYATEGTLAVGESAADVAELAEPRGVEMPYEDAAAYDDYGRYRAGTPIDESTRLQLREERLRVDKSQVARGEATVGTEVVSQTEELDIPLVREELFIERRPVSSGGSGGGPVGESELIRVPLTEERLVVTKEPVVVEEIVVGKRQVSTTEHISETTRKERLNVVDVDDTSRHVNNR